VCLRWWHVIALTVWACANCPQLCQLLALSPKAQIERREVQCVHSFLISMYSRMLWIADCNTFSTIEHSNCKIPWDCLGMTVHYPTIPFGLLQCMCYRDLRKCLGNSQNAWIFLDCLGICRKWYLFDNVQILVSGIVSVKKLLQN